MGVRASPPKSSRPSGAHTGPTRTRRSPRKPIFGLTFASTHLPKIVYHVLLAALLCGSALAASNLEFDVDVIGHPTGKYRTHGVPDQTLLSLREAIERVSGIELDQQRLVFCGKLLPVEDDQKKLSDLRIKADFARVHLMEKAYLEQCKANCGRPSAAAKRFNEPPPLPPANANGFIGVPVQDQLRYCIRCPAKPTPQKDESGHTWSDGSKFEQGNLRQRNKTP